MNARRKLLIALGAGLLAVPLAADAQPTGKVYGIGFIGIKIPQSLLLRVDKVIE